MKKYLLGGLAFFAAFMSILGTRIKDPTNSLDSLYWYQNTSLTDCTSLNTSSFLLEPISSNPYGCPDAGTKCCARGFTLDHTKVDPNNPSNRVPIDVNNFTVEDFKN
jgi:hypothetical protein